MMVITGAKKTWGCYSFSLCCQPREGKSVEKKWLTIPWSKWYGNFPIRFSLCPRFVVILYTFPFRECVADFFFRPDCRDACRLSWQNKIANIFSYPWFVSRITRLKSVTILPVSGVGRSLEHHILGWMAFKSSCLVLGKSWRPAGVRSERTDRKSSIYRT